MKIGTLEELRNLYDQPGERAQGKELSALDVHMKTFLSHSPFCVVSTVGSDGTLDASPRGGQPGFVFVVSDRRILIPDFKGNNRLDSLTNVVETGRVGLLCLVPGVDETLRINGSAFLSTDPELLAPLSYQSHPPKLCVVVDVEQAFLHCAKALMRSKLWDPNAQLDRSELPTMGQMLKDQLGGDKAPETQEEMVARYSKDL